MKGPSPLEVEAGRVSAEGLDDCRGAGRDVLEARLKWAAARIEELEGEYYSAIVQAVAEVEVHGKPDSAAVSTAFLGMFRAWTADEKMAFKAALREVDAGIW